MTTPHPAFECLDVKVRLSAYLDGEITAEDRLQLDRHVLACGGCRDLLERAEALDSEIRSLADDAMPGVLDDSRQQPQDDPILLPATFGDDILRRTRSGDVQRHRAFRSFGQSVWQSVGLLAAAACLGVVATLSFVAMTDTAERGESAGEERSLVGHDLQSQHDQSDQSDRRYEQLADGVCGPPRPLFALQTQPVGPKLARDEAQAILSAAQVLRAIVETPYEDGIARERLRRTTRYDELLSRLCAIERKLEPHDRRVIAAAKAIVVELQRETCDLGSWALLREDLRLLDVQEQLDDLLARSEASNAV